MLLTNIKNTKTNKMAEKKSIYEEAMLDVKKIQEALNANTKEILRSVAREEIDGVVKESLMDDDYDEETVSDETGEESGAEGEEKSGEAMPSDLDVPDVAGDEAGVEMDGEAEIQPSDEVGSDDQALGMDADDAFGGDELDMTAASDDAIIAIYKKLSGDDEIEVVGDDVHLNISEPGEYIIKGAAAGVGGGADESDMDDLGGEAGETDDWEEVGDEEAGEEVAGGDDDLDYEIAMDDESGDDDEEESMMAESKDKDKSTKPTWIYDKNGNKKDVSEPMTADQIKKLKETEDDESVIEATEEDEDVVKEAIPVGLAQGKRLPGKSDIGQPIGAGGKAAGLKKESVSQLESKYRATLNESAQLKLENEEFRKALKKFRNMLVETVVFNSNLSYVTKLFMEHSTTKDEKQRIIQRFDAEVTNLKESKKLYKTIVTELTDKKSITEAVENKITKEVGTGSSKQLNEATAYVDQSTQRIKDLINRVENR